MTAKRAAIVGLFFVLIFDVWWRCHTISGSVREKIGFAPWPVVAEAEPLDCDEALYAYMGKRMVLGDVMYRDLTEFKPPLGYWIYALAVRIGGPTELCIRLIPIPFVLATIVLIWWITFRVSGPFAAVFASFLYSIMSTDPYVYANGANMEHFMNLFSTTAFALTVHAWTARKPMTWAAVGALIAAASLVKQVAFLPLLPLALCLLFRKTDESRRSKLLSVLAILAGFALIWTVVLGILSAQGALRDAYEAIFRYGGALASQTPADPQQYSFFVRWIVGNTDPAGLLPWPFGKTDGRAWWAAGLWPIWLASIPITIVALLKRDVFRQLVAAWVLISWLEVAMPGLFWQHYYMLPIPGIAILIAITFSDCVTGFRSHKARSKLIYGLAVLSLLVATVATVVIQTRDYFLVSPDNITTRYKGGRQWVVLRQFGTDLGKRARGLDSPRLFVWGIHSPLLFYSHLDSMTRQIFVDPLMLADAQRILINNAGVERLLNPRKTRTILDLNSARPELIFLGAPPFPALEQFVTKNYRQVRDYIPGLYVRNDLITRF